MANGVDPDQSPYVCMANSVDPDQTLYSKASDLDLQHLQRPTCPKT